MANYIATTEQFTATADAIRAKTGSSADLEWDASTGYADDIAAIPTGVDTSDATAAAGDILSGKTAYVDGSKVTGNIATKTVSNLSVDGKTVTVPAGYYASQATKDVATGSATAPASITGSSATVSTGTNTLTLSKTVSVTPSVTAGYVASGTAGNSFVSLTAAVTTKAAATITPGTTNQTIAAGTYLTGAQTIAGDADLIAGNIKKDVTIFGVTGTLAGSGDAYAAISVTYPVGSTCTVTNGSVTYTAADTSGQVVFGIPEPSSTPETWTVSCTNGTDSDSTTVSIEEYGQIESVSLGYVFVYGVSWDGTSTTSWTRTDMAANFSDPVPYVAGATNYGSPFDTIFPWSDMTIVEDIQAGTMVKIPKFWYKLTQNGSGMQIQISNTVLDGYSVCPACMDRGDGKGERDYILVGRYHCANTYKSTTGVRPVASKTRSAFRNGIQGLGTGIYMMDWATRFTIFLLYLVEYADWNSQQKIGYGCGNSKMGNVGYTDSMPYHTGTSLSSRTSYGLGTQYRYIEGLWDDYYDWIDGCYNSSSGLMLILDPTKFSDSANGKWVGDLPTYDYPYRFTVKTITNMFPLFIPSSADTYAHIESFDMWDFDTGRPCIMVGGDTSPTKQSGLFRFDSNGTSSSNGNISSRSMKVP